MSPRTEPVVHRTSELGALNVGTLIDGTWRDGERTFDVLDKFSGAAVVRVPESTRAQVADAVAHVADFVRTSNRHPPAERAAILRACAELVERQRDQLAAVLASEAGFTARDARTEIDRTKVTLRLCAEAVTRLTGECVPFGASPGFESRLGFTVREPLGVVCAITPFNSPLNVVSHKIGPAIAGGNAVVLKPSALAPLSASILCDLLLEAGLHPGLLSMVNSADASAGIWLGDEQAIDFYAFTGSTAVGREIQRAAGLRRTQMELGSIASTIVCLDADLDRAASRIVNAGFRKAGQVCTSVQRVYAERPIADRLIARLVEEAEAMSAGDPREPATDVGPMISEAAAIRVESWVKEAREAGAAILCGGVRSGSVFAPTVITGARPGLRVIDEEIFGPVVSVLVFDDLEDALDSANGTPFGLSVGFFSNDMRRVRRAIRSLRMGSIHINDASSSRADEMPFGGVKESGFGREGPHYAVREMTEERLVTFNE
jgi:succinate-semialdehyde dehydrogenase/glutarate-semialdehyde dehydrogenase